MTNRRDVVVVGAGIFGVTAALELQCRGYQVGVLDPGAVPYPLAASTDISKVVRTDYGADAESKQELFPDALELADALFCDRKSQCLRLGELHHGLDAGVISEESPITELGEVTAGVKPGRRNQDEITICDLTGTGVQDTVIATLAYQKAREQGLGLEIVS